MEGMPAEGTALPEIGAVIAGKYRIESVLGQGGMGAVFAARNVMTGKRVAIKWLLPEHAVSTTRERLLREAQIASSIDHPNVVDIYDVGEHQGGMFLVMEYLRGKPLSELLAERGRLDPEELIALLVPAMRGVHAAHQAGVIHRDLKPENIILSESDGQIVPKVVDFGVSKTIGASSVPNSSLTRTGALVGTPHYMALEQVDGSNAVDARTDVYAFGVLLYRALTGHVPFDGTSLGEVILKIGTKDATPMRMLRPDLPPALDTAVLRALSRQREKRFADLEQFARALMPFVSRRPGDSEDSLLMPGAVLFRSLSLHDLDGRTHGGESGPRPIVRGEVAAASSAVAVGRRRGRLVASAVLALLLVGAGVLVSQRARRAPMAVEGALATPAPAPLEGELAERAGTAAAAGGLAGEPEPVGAPHGALEPAEPAAQLPMAAGILPGASAAGEDGLATPTPASTAQRGIEPAPAAAPAEQVRGREKRHGERSRTHSGVTSRKSSAPTVIRGDRTNGFSLDEF